MSRKEEITELDLREMCCELIWGKVRPQAEGIMGIYRATEQISKARVIPCTKELYTYIS